MKNISLQIIATSSDELPEATTPLASVPVQAGFPSPAEDYMVSALDLNRLMVHNPATTFFAHVAGDSMKDRGIEDGDLLVIDRSVEPCDGCIAVCYIDGEFTLKYFRDQGDHALLVPANEKYKPIKVTGENDFMIWGVVRYVVKKV